MFCGLGLLLYWERRKNTDGIRIRSCEQCGAHFEYIYPHVLRHTFATRGLENGIKPKVMQELLGHTSITMTLDIYSHVLPDRFRANPANPYIYTVKSPAGELPGISRGV